MVLKMHNNNTSICNLSVSIGACTCPSAYCWWRHCTHSIISPCCSDWQLKALPEFQGAFCASRFLLIGVR